MLPPNRLILVDFLEGPKIWAYCIRQVIDFQCGHRKDILVMEHRDPETDRTYEFVLDTDRFSIVQEVDPYRNEYHLVVMAYG